MKNKTLILVSILLGTSISFISSSQANAGECSAADPCSGWAVLDNNNVVVNTIVCQVSVCGSGQFAGLNVVQQTAANPETNDTTGVGGIMSDVDQKVVYNNNTFEIHRPGSLTNTETFIEQDNSITTLTTEVSEQVFGFTYNDTKNNLNLGLVTKSMAPHDDTSAQVSLKNIKDSTITQEDYKFYNRKTINEIENEFFINKLNLLIARINNIIKMLDSWVKN